MTTPVNVLHPVEFETPPLIAAGFGLLTVATVIEQFGPVRVLGGLSLRSVNCDVAGVGLYSAELCSEDAPQVKAPADRPAPTVFDPFVPWAAAECRPDEPESDTLARAIRHRELHEPLLIESAFADRLLADAGTPTVVPDLVSAIGVLEETLGEFGYNGAIHAARRWLAPLVASHLTTATGPVLRSPAGHRIAVGGGYSDLGNTLIATGPVFVWRHQPDSTVVTTGNHVEPELGNTRYALSERVMLVAYECPIAAVQIDATP
ncbi:hypothetical protein [Nocardia farcinica]|uniref:hypothetical protein n=1 Tax=Nocardia farcinica TaxID=37329 RepID=UPI0018940812|nr:hypothetical protein [Nocardia farcinica]MBF6372979.1 hypothetical protein [Nocardia farcinica]